MNAVFASVYASRSRSKRSASENSENAIDVRDTAGSGNEPLITSEGLPSSAIRLYPDIGPI
jgi:hypothetical protein